MNEGQLKVAQMGVKAQAFVETKASSFNHSPATLVDTTFVQTKRKLDNAITALGGKEAIEMNGGVNEGAVAKSTRPHDLEKLIRDANRTAGAIAEEKSKPEIMDRFRMPHDNGGGDLKTKTRSMTQAIQMRRGFIKRTGVKSTSRHELEELLCDTNLTAGAIAEEQQKPEIMDRFRIPHGTGDGELKIQTLLMAQAILDLGLDADFAAHGMGRVASSTLLTAADAFQGNEGDHAPAPAPQVGAPVSIPELLRQIKCAAKTFDSIFHNVFKGDPETLGAWKTASQVEKVAGPAETLVLAHA